MTPRRLPLRPGTYSFPGRLSAHAPAPAADVGWTRKTVALAMHLACLGLFGLTVVWPVASPVARGELMREFKPLLEVVARWTS